MQAVQNNAVQNNAAQSSMKFKTIQHNSLSLNRRKSLLLHLSFSNCTGSLSRGEDVKKKLYNNSLYSRSWKLRAPVIIEMSWQFCYLHTRKLQSSSDKMTLVKPSKTPRKFGEPPFLFTAPQCVTLSLNKSHLQCIFRYFAKFQERKNNNPF